MCSHSFGALRFEISINGAIFPLRALGNSSSLPFCFFWCLPAFLSIPWFVDASLHSLLTSSHLCVSASAVSVCLVCLLRHQLLHSGSNLLHYDLILTNNICKDLTVPSGHVLRFYVDLNSGRALQPTVPSQCFFLQMTYWDH